MHCDCYANAIWQPKGSCACLLRCVANFLSININGNRTEIASSVQMCAIAFCADFFPSCSSPPYFLFPVWCPCAHLYTSIIMAPRRWNSGIDSEELIWLVCAKQYVYGTARFLNVRTIPGRTEAEMRFAKLCMQTGTVSYPQFTKKNVSIYATCVYAIYAVCVILKPTIDEDHHQYSQYWWAYP